ncbi:MAG: hypothetical protein JW839_18760 [Candidatus Lokiarchaeota archaeon]|nr:hypothetical protein [Candidatus Lokiarchaeota archaeon]
MRVSQDQRLVHAFVGSGFAIGGGVYCLCILGEMGTYGFVPAVIAAIMFTGAYLMRDPIKEKVGGLVLLFGVVFLFMTFNQVTGSMVSRYSIDLGSEDLNFAIVDRAIYTVTAVLGGTYGLMGAIDGVFEKDVFLRALSSWHIPQITALLNAGITGFSLLWIAFYLMIVRHPIESLLYLPMAAGAMIAFFVAWWALSRRKCIGVVVIGNFLCALLSGFLSLLDFIYLPLCVLNLLSNAALIATTNEELTFTPRWKPRDKKFEIASIFLVIGAVGIVPLPFIIGTWPATTITVPKGQEADVMEIHWAIGSEQKGDWDWYTQPEVLNTLLTINGNTSNWGINVSVVVPYIREMREQPAFGDVIVDIMENLTSASITWDIMPVIENSVFGSVDEYLWDGNIDRFRRFYDDMREWLRSEGIINYVGDGPNLSQDYRGLVLDLERTQQISGSITNLVMEYMDGPESHVLASNNMVDFLAYCRSKENFIAGAFFDFHIFDFVDMDDAQQEFFKISIVPPTDWDHIASMVYQTGPGSNLSVLAYANDMNYHFGDRGVPYVVTMNSDYEDILTRFRIMKNTGFPRVGAWAMHELFFNGTSNDPDDPEFNNTDHDLFNVDRPHRATNGSRDTWTFQKFIQLHEDLGQDVDVTFTFDQLQSENLYYQLALLLDIWLVRRPIYTSWPIMGSRMPNPAYPQIETFTTLCIVTFIVIGFFVVYIAWDPYHRKPKERTQKLDATTAALLGRKGEGSV